MKPAPPDPAILQFANHEQRKKLQLWIDHGTAAKAAEAYNEMEGTKLRAADMVSVKTTVISRAAQAGWAPSFDATRHVPPTEQVMGRSVLTKDDEGNTIWLKTKQRQESDVLREVMDELSSGLKPFKKVKEPNKTDDDLIVVYTITDYHIGAYSWAPETGADWDIDIAESVLLHAISDMMDGSPDSKEAVFCQLGDFLHWDGLLAVTPTAKNVLDADTRYPLLVKMAIKCCLKAVEMLLHKHEIVHVKMCEGNHDLAGSVWLQQLMVVMFQDNPRVKVDESSFPYYYHVFGNNFLGWHHGHLSRIKQLPSKFWSEFGNVMGGCQYRFIHTGHLHTKEVIESAGVIVERHPTLNARDAHGARGFDLTIRAAQAISYMRAGGEKSRNIVYPRAA
jgi:hypothetical protein